MSSSDEESNLPSLDPELGLNARGASLLRQVVGNLFKSLMFVVSGMFIALAFISANNTSAVLQEDVGGLSPEMVLVSPIPPSSTGIDYGTSANSLTLGDVTTLSRPGYVKAASSVAPTTNLQLSAQYAARSAPTTVIGTTQSYASTTGFTVASGRFIDYQDVYASTPVAVLGYTVAVELFGSENPIGQTIYLSGHPFQTIGVLGRRGFGGSDNLDDRIVVPETTMWGQLIPGGGKPISQILMRSNSPSLATEAAQEAESILLTSHQISDPFQADFSVVTQHQLVAPQLIAEQTLKRVLVIISLVMLVLSAIHLSYIVDLEFSERGRHVMPVQLDVLLIYRALSLGLLGSAIGVAIAVILARTILTLASPGIVVSSPLTLDEVGFTLAIGVAFSLMSLLPQAVGMPRKSKASIDGA